MGTARTLASALVIMLIGPPTAAAGGLVLPGNGAISTSRAGAWIVGAQGADALAVNPAGLTRRSGSHFSVSSVLVDYSLTFSRRGTYDQIDNVDLPWEGQPYTPVSDESKPEVGIAGYQAIPNILFTTDLNRYVRGLYVGFGFFAPNAYPTRSLGAGYTIDDPNTPPPASRYDIVTQEAVFVEPSIALAYEVSDTLSIGGRFSSAATQFGATTYLWGQLNYEEWTGADTVFRIDATDWFVPGFAVGAQWRATPNLEFGLHVSTALTVKAKGTANSFPSASLSVGGLPLEITPVDDSLAQCAPGGTVDAIQACIDFSLPMTASAGARYVFRDASGTERGDLELNSGWENWSSERASNFKIVVDGQVNDSFTIKKSYLRHGLQDVLDVRLGGSYNLPLHSAVAIIRAGVGYETAAAKAGWERVDFDGAAKTTVALGASYRTGSYQFDLGVGAIFQGTRDMPGNCNPTVANLGCAGDGTQQPIEERTGPDPTNGANETENQAESPFNQGTFTSGYNLLMLGVSTSF